MVSAVGLQWATSLFLKLDLLSGCTSNCLAKFNVDAVASACVANILGLLAKICTCCCAEV
ncbi:hypothetical protein MKX01_028707 [Papaver californicum]|nr:hypothetical protein MKX01_028707 [Papaver californicum]